MELLNLSGFIYFQFEYFYILDYTLVVLDGSVSRIPGFHDVRCEVGREGWMVVMVTPSAGLARRW